MTTVTIQIFKRCNMSSPVTITLQENDSFDNGEIPTRPELLHLFNEKRRENASIPLYELVHLLGGIDVVMNIMMNAPNLKMRDECLQSMHRILTDQSSSPPTLAALTSDVDIITKMMSYSKDMETKQMLRWCLDPHNNYLHEKSTFWENFIFSKYMLLIVVGGVLLGAIVRNTAPMWIYNTYMLLMQWIIWIPWDISALMSVNKAMIPRIAATVDTWMKVYTMIMAMVYTTIYNVMTSDSPAPLIIVFYGSAAIHLGMCFSKMSI